jgi:hypothetical protein
LTDRAKGEAVVSARGQEDGERGGTDGAETGDDARVEEEGIASGARRGCGGGLAILKGVLDRHARGRKAEEGGRVGEWALQRQWPGAKIGHGADARGQLEAHDDPAGPEAQALALDKLAAAPSRGQSSAKDARQVGLLAGDDETMQGAQHRQRVRDDRVVIWCAACRRAAAASSVSWNGSRLAGAGRRTWQEFGKADAVAQGA